MTCHAQVCDAGVPGTRFPGRKRDLPSRAVARRKRALFKLAAFRGTLLVTSRFAVEEAFRNIAIKTPQHIVEGESLLTDVAEVAEPSAAWLDVARQDGVPPKDAPILGAAMAHAADLLVTGDRSHFGHLYGMHIQGVLVVPPATAVGLLLNGRT